MNEYLVRAFDHEQYPPENFRAVVMTGMHGEEYVLDILHTEDPTLSADSLIGAWNRAGEKVAPFDLEAFEVIRPLGNNPDGSATKDLIFHHFSGWGQRQLGTPAATPEPAAPQVAALYPEENQPFPIRIAHKYFDGHADPNHDGWGWRAEIDPSFVPTTRDPAAYFINIYTNPECRVEDNWYDAAGFSKGPSEWFFDEEGEPIEVWMDEYDQAYLGQGDKAPIHYGVCKGSIHIQEGFGTLSLDDDYHDLLFWEFPQGHVPGPGEDWVDTGATVTGQSGQLFYISDPDVVAALTVGQAIRFGPSLETAFAGIWAGTDNLIQINPYVAAQAGQKLWSWQ